MFDGTSELLNPPRPPREASPELRDHMGMPVIQTAAAVEAPGSVVVRDAAGEERDVPPADLVRSKPVDASCSELAAFDQLAVQLAGSKDPWERSGSDRPRTLLEMIRSGRPADPAIVAGIRRQYARNAGQRGTVLGKAIDELAGRLTGYNRGR